MERMKKTLWILGLVFMTQLAQAQEEEAGEKRGFKKENFFTGGSISLAISNYTFGIGATPEFGYSLARFVDLGILGNYNYTSYRNYPIQGQIGTLKQTIYGGGAFTRIFPARFLFAQAQFEHNWIDLKYKYSGGRVKDNVSANSFLVGAGYCTGRDPDAKSVYGYFSVLVDVLKEENSPYVNYDYDVYGNITGTRAVPIVRAGLIVPLFQGSHHR